MNSKLELTQAEYQRCLDAIERIVAARRADLLKEQLG